MPPRKRAKVGAAASTPSQDIQPKTPQEPDPPLPQDHLHDLWADEQETQLFKSMMKWKPTGLHKHFRMICIHGDMRSQGFATDDAPHTRIPGIWQKLHQLYDLDALDVRENDFAFADDPDPTDPTEASSIPEFELPEDEFGELMWYKRFHNEASEAASSPPAMSVADDRALYTPGIGLLKDLPASLRSRKVARIREAAFTPKTTKNTRASRSAAKSGRGTKATAVSAKKSKARSTLSESAEENGVEEEQSSTESVEDSAPVTRRTQRPKPKPVPRRTRRR